MSIGRKLSDVFSRAAANLKRAFVPQSKLATYRYSRPYNFTVGDEFTGKPLYRARGRELGWAEAIAIDSDKYKIRIIKEQRHNLFAVTGNGEKSYSDISFRQSGRDIFSRDEAVQILKKLEEDFSGKGWRVDVRQPLRALHYSRFNPPVREGEPPSPQPA